DRRVRRPARNWANPDGFACVMSILFDVDGANRKVVSAPALWPRDFTQADTRSAAAFWPLVTTVIPFTEPTITARGKACTPHFKGSAPAGQNAPTKHV